MSRCVQMYASWKLINTIKLAASNHIIHPHPFKDNKPPHPRFFGTERYLTEVSNSSDGTSDESEGSGTGTSVGDGGAGAGGASGGSRRLGYLGEKRYTS